MRKPSDLAREMPIVSPWEPPEGLRGFVSYGAELLAEADKPVRFVVDRLIQEDDVILISGREKLSLKTMLALDLAISRVLGAEWIGFRCADGKPGAVLYISTETSKRAIGRRLRGLCAGRGVRAEDVVPFIALYDMPVSMIPRATRERASDAATLKAKMLAARTFKREQREDIVDNLDVIAESEAAGLGRNLSVLAAVEEARRGTWSLIVIDTLRGCLEGDDNSSNDARAFMQAVRELARAAGCPVATVHHNNKSGDASDSRSSRGSVELTAAPDVLITIDAGGDYPTAHFTLRNHEAPAPTGYELLAEKGESGNTLRIQTREPAVGGGKDGVTADDVVAVLETEVGLTTNRIRQLVAEKRGAKGKANQKTVEKLLESLASKKAVSPCQIERKNGETFPGWRLGPEGGTVPSEHQSRERPDYFNAL